MAAQLQTALYEILNWGHVKAAAEAAQAFAFADKCGCGYIVQSDMVDIILANKAEHLLETELTLAVLAA